MISFFVPGVPVPKGSGRAFYNKKRGMAFVIQDNAARQKPWASLISFTAQEAGCQMAYGGVSLGMLFTMPRPKSHYRTGKNASQLKTVVPTFHTGTPDLDKLIRCVKDALKGIVYKDDSQVCRIAMAEKMYGEHPGVKISIEEI